MSPSVHFRLARPQDLGCVRRWDEEPHVIACDPNDDWDWEIELGRTVDWREQWIASVDGRSIGFLQIIDPAREESHYWGEVLPTLRAIDVWIGEADALGRGFGTQMMTFALSRCFADEQVTAVLVDPLASHTRVHPFYERLGFRWIATRQFGADLCRVYELTHDEWKRRR